MKQKDRYFEARNREIERKCSEVIMSSPCHVFKTGMHAVKLLSVHQEDSCSSAAPPPPKPLLVSTPCEEGEFPVLIFLHGFLLYNSFYSQLLQHISSHGFIVVAPQVNAFPGGETTWVQSCSDAKAPAGAQWCRATFQACFGTGAMVPTAAQWCRLRRNGADCGAMAPCVHPVLLYTIAGPDSSQEISDAAKITDWLINGLVHILPNHVHPNLGKLAIAGHSRGGKVAFALALGHAKTSLTFSALMTFDPVDGMDKGKQTNPPILTYVPHSFDLKMAALVIGSGLGGLKKNFFFPPCSPKGVSHQDFYDECKPPACHLVARDYGHLDILDDETKGVRGKSTYCLCVNGKSREPMRNFAGGAMVAFMRAYLDGDMKDLWTLRDNPELAIPVTVSIACFQE